MPLTYNILEIANVHDGDLNYLLELLDEYADVPAQGIKLQVLKPDEIAVKEFAWFNVYEQLYFNPTEWKQIINKASETKQVWIDVFDKYAIEIISENYSKVYGLKFQASILYNKKLIREFATLNLSQMPIMLNIAGIAIEDIQAFIDEFQLYLKPKEIILQIGFQGYPTQLEDSGLVKIKTITETFKKRIAFADHIDATHEDALTLPVLASLNGAYIIEKHIRKTGPLPKYDFYSAVEKAPYLKYLDLLNRFHQTAAQPFINKNEKIYLKNSIQMPILATSRKAGQMIDLVSDLSFKRTNSSGLRTNEVQNLINNFYILGREKKAGETLLKEDFKKANIATIIACRLKSTRLPRKAALKIGSLPSVELCIKKCLEFENTNHTILATSTTEEDAELKNFTYSPQVIFHTGDPDDVMLRYLAIADKLNIDIIVRVTADMPYVSKEITEILLKSHFETGADFTKPAKAAVGTNVEIISVQALRYAKSFFPNANYSEYMSWYFNNNPEHFRINTVELPAHLVRDYRLTIDHQEDLDMFNKIEEHFVEKKLDYSTEELFNFLDASPEVVAINAHIGVTYKTDQKLIDTLNKVTKI